MPDSFRLYLLGGFRLENDKGEIVLPRAKVKTLLAYLALHPQEHPRELLASLFWGDVPDEQARTSLRVALNALRKEIHPDLILADRETVQRNPAFPLWTDAVSIAQIANRVSQDGNALTISDMQSAIREYRGEILAGFYDEWIEAAREKYRAQYLELLVRVTEHYRSASDYANAILYAQKILETERAHETAHQHLIFLYAAQGDRAAALKQFDECVRALDEELGVEPSPETIALAKQINKKPTAKSDAAAQTNLPRPLTSFVGRERELEEIRDMLGGARVASPSSLLTLTGAGGSGKTRLAIQTGRALLEDYADGVWWVELAPLSESALVPQQIAKAIGVQQEANDPITQTLVNALRAREMLLILDNCEHVVDACAQLAELLLGECERLQILATSREALNIAGEQTFPVAPLDLPRATIAAFAAQALEFSAVRLFVERARFADARFEVSESNVPPIAQICTRLDGIPLAIELAAARVKQMSVSEIAVRLDSRFDLLIGTRTASPRQQTLRALIDWSYNLLSADERAFFNRLGVFAGSWSAEATARVAGENVSRAASALRLSALVDKSLVVADTGESETRYHMLETIREYAREKLEQAGELALAQEKHLAYFVQMAEDAAPRLWGRETLPTLERLEREHDNMRAALHFALASDDIASAVALAGALGYFWHLRNYFDEAERWYTQILERDMSGVSPRRRAWLYSGAGTLAWGKIDFPRAERIHRRALELFEEAGDTHGIALSWNNVGVQLARMSQFEPARQAFMQAIELARKHNDAQVTVYALNSFAVMVTTPEKVDEIAKLYDEAWQIAEREGDANAKTALGANLAELARERGDYARALELAEQALASAREVGNYHMIHMLFREQSSMLGLLRRFDEAKSVLREAFVLAQKSRDPWLMGASFSRWGWLEFMIGNFERAVRLMGYADACFERFPSATLPPAQSNRLHHVIGELRAALGEERFAQEWARGKNMTETEAFQYVQETEMKKDFQN